MIVCCYICENEFTVPFEEWEDIDELDDYVCEECAETAIKMIVARQ